MFKILKKIESYLKNLYDWLWIQFKLMILHIVHIKNKYKIDIESLIWF